MLRELRDRRQFEEIHRKLVFLAWLKYRIRSIDAEDIAQTAFTAYCECRGRYAGEKNQFGILLGIFYKKCLEFIHRSKRESQGLKRMCQTADAVREHPWIDPEQNGPNRGVLEELIEREDGKLILSALAELRPPVRQMFRLLAEEDVGRKGLIDHFGVNKNTLDSRLRSARLELRKALRAKGVII